MTNPLIWSITTEESVTSTSDLAKQAAAEGAPSGSGFLAFEQSEGRGRQGRHWSSKKGGMYLSVLLRPKAEKKQWFALSFAASLAVLDTIRDQLGPHFDAQTIPQSGLKWPNDVMIACRKIAGILLEAEGQSIIVGIGINIASVEVINHQAYPQKTIAPVALADIWPQTAGDLPAPFQLARDYMKRLDYWYNQFEQNGFTPIRDAWLTNALFLGKTLSVRRGNSQVSGVFQGLGMDGSLVLLDDLGRTHHITTGEVKLLDI